MKAGRQATGAGEKGRKGRKPHILVVSQYFHPETFRINDMAMEWVKRGYQVTVLTGIPNYPMGKFFDGYGLRKRRREIWNGINIIRIPLIPRGNSGNKAANSLGMIANYLSFVASGWWWNVTADIRADLVFTFEVSPMTQALVSVWYAKKHKVPHLLYVQDLWPENVELVTGIKNPIIIKPIDCMVDYIYKNTAEIFTTSQSFVKAIVDRNAHICRRKVHYWPQYAEAFYKPMKREIVRTSNLAPEIPDDKAFKIVFTGNIGYAQGLDILPKTAELLKDRDIKFVIVGEGRYQKDLESEIDRRKVRNKFIMVPKQDAKRIPYLLSVCDIAYLSYPDPQTIPAKLQSYMACGKYILASAGKETKNIIESADCGTCCDYGDEKGLADAIASIMGKPGDIDSMGRNSRKYYLEHFEKNRLMDEMDFYFRKLSGDKEL